VFEDERDALSLRGLGGGAELVVDGCAVGCLVFETPEIEAADFVGLELFRERDACGEDVVLLVEVGRGGVVLVAGAEFRARRARPVNLEERTADVGDAQVVLRQDGLRAGDIVGVEVGDVLAQRARISTHPRPKSFAATEQACSKSSEVSSVMTLSLNRS